MSAAALAVPAFWREATPEAKRALLAASLGWMLDAFDVMLYSLVLAELVRRLRHHAERRPGISGRSRWWRRRSAA